MNRTQPRSLRATTLSFVPFLFALLAPCSLTAQQGLGFQIGGVKESAGQPDALIPVSARSALLGGLEPASARFGLRVASERM